MRCVKKFGLSNTLKTLIMIILKYFVNHNYYDLMTLCCFCDDSLITLGWYVYDLGIMLGPLWGHIGLLFASL